MCTDMRACLRALMHKRVFVLCVSVCVCVCVCVICVQYTTTHLWACITRIVCVVFFVKPLNPYLMIELRERERDHFFLTIYLCQLVLLSKSKNTCSTGFCNATCLESLFYVPKSSRGTCSVTWGQLLRMYWDSRELVDWLFSAC